MKDVLRHCVFPYLSDLDISRFGKVNTFCQRQVMDHYERDTSLAIWEVNASEVMTWPWLSLLTDIVINGLGMDCNRVLLPFTRAKKIEIRCLMENDAIVDLQTDVSADARIAPVVSSGYGVFRLTIGFSDCRYNVSTYRCEEWRKRPFHPPHIERLLYEEEEEEIAEDEQHWIARAEEEEGEMDWNQLAC